MMSGHIHVEQSDGVLFVTLNRTEKKNALTQAMYGELADAIARVESEHGVRVLHITGSGDAFTSGNDVSEFGAAKQPTSATEVTRFLTALITTDIPIVAAVNGMAVGVGVTMLLHVDFVFAAREATFKTPFIDLALVPEAASSLRMPQEMGYRKAASMLMLGERLDAQQALDAGIVSEVVDRGALLERSSQVARQLAAKPASALRTTKRLMRRDPEPLTERLDFEFKEFGRALKSPEAEEAVSAFMQKRKPDFSKFE
jgi:enoyl-CoA hydratase/carnithine racemase